MLRGKADRLVELFGLRNFCDADRGAGVRGLHKDREIEACQNFVEDLLAVRRVAVGIEPEVVRLLDVGAREQRVGDGLIHADSGREGAAADVRDTAQLEKALNRAVLAVLAVQDGEDHIELAEGAGAALFEDDKPRRTAVRRKEGRAVFGVIHPRVVFNRIDVAGIEQPAAVLCDAERHDVKFFRIEVAENGGGGHQRNLIFRGCAAKNHTNRFFHSNHRSLLNFCQELVPPVRREKVKRPKAAPNRCRLYRFSIAYSYAFFKR